MKYEYLYKKCKTYNKKATEATIRNATLKLLYSLYFTHEISTIEIAEKFKIPKKRAYLIANFLKEHGFSLRKPSEASALVYKNNRIPRGKHKNYKTGYHTTWFNYTFHYRSSYELIFAKHLDEQKLTYEYESKKIRYYDTQKKQWRYAIPDFYIPSMNTIVEIKSQWTYDPTNMKDKEKFYKKAGYSFNLLLDEDIQNLA